MKIFLLGILYQVALVAVFLPQGQSANTDQIDFTQAQIEGLVRDIMWCGKENEAILVLTDKGILYRSRDKG